MKKKFYIICILLSLAGFRSRAQISISNASSCFADTLHAVLTGLTPVASGITGDDNWSDIIPIGFTYNFFGTPNTQCLIGSNGCLGFDVSYALGYNTWPIGATLASSTGSGDIHNLIAGPWCDVYIPAGGTIMYSTVGTAPNRKFEVTWCGTAMYGCTTEWLTTQIIIYETTGVAEVHCGHHTSCWWNGGYAIIGVKNPAGSYALTAPSRDYPTTWTVLTGEGWRFTPVGTTSFTCSSIPYAPIPYASSSVYWYDSATHTYLGSGLSTVVTPSVTTTYMACAVGCNDTTRAYITVGPVGTGSVTGGVPHISYVTDVNPTDCGWTKGSITIHGLVPGQIDTVFMTIGGVPSHFVDTVLSDSTMTFTNLNTGVYTIYVKHGPCPSNTVTVTLTMPTLQITATSFTNPTLCGLCDGTITLAGLWAGATVDITYSYDGIAQSYTGVVAIDSTLVLQNLCSKFPTSLYSGITATVGHCTATTADITLTSPTIAATVTNPTLCGKSDGKISLYQLPADSVFQVTFVGPGVGSGSMITVNPFDTLVIPNLLASPTSSTYSSIVASINGINCPAGPVVLTSPPINAGFVNPTICGKNDGAIFLYQLPGDSVFTVTFSGPGSGSGSLITVNSNDTLTIPNLIAGLYPSPYTTITAMINGVSCVAGPITLTDPPVTAVFDTSLHLGCRGDTVFVNSSSTPAGYNYNWNFGDGSAIVSSTNNTSNHIYNDYPSYISNDMITLVYYTYASAPGCYDSMKIPVNINHTMAAAYAPTTDTVCLVPATPISFTNSSFGIGINSYWTFGDGQNSTSTTPIHTYGAGGVYQTSLKVTDFLGCDSTVFGIVDVITIGIRTVTHDTTVCLTEPMEMIAHVDAVPGTYQSISYLWTNSANLTGTDDTITYFMPVVGDYTYTITATTTPLGCVATDTETIHSKPPLKMTNITPNKTIPYGSSVQLNADNADFFTWMPNDGTLTNTNINNPVATPHDSTTYVVYGMTIYGCRDTAYITIDIDYAMNGFAPTAFSPNGDGQNDKFRIVNLKYQKLVELRVFNRWGVEVFHTSNSEDGWDGTYGGVPQDIGTYNYVYILARPEGTQQTYTGTVTLIR